MGLIKVDEKLIQECMTSIRKKIKNGTWVVQGDEVLFKDVEIDEIEKRARNKKFFNFKP